MKKALIITYYWPPSGGSGVQRWVKFVKYLREFGWEPIVYCPENPEYPETDHSLLLDIPREIRVIRHPIWEPYSAYKKFLGRAKDEKIEAGFLTEKRKPALSEKIAVWIRGNFFIPDARRFWIKPSARFLKKVIAAESPDIIITTGPPHSCHLIGLRLKKAMKVTWLADFRDPWTKIYFYDDLKLTSLADSFHHRLEKEVLQKADAVSTVGNTLAEDFSNIVPRKYEVISNGFDEEDFARLSPPTPDPRFSIAFIGTFVPSMNHAALWEALAELVKENAAFAADLEIKLAGKVDISAMESIKNSGLAPYLNKLGYVPHEQAVGLMTSSAVLLLLNANTPYAKGIITGKFFEYMAAQRPILAMGPADSDVARILAETSAGKISEFTDKDSLKDNILGFYSQFKQGTLKVDPGNISRFSRRELTKKLAALLDELSGESQ